jgi:Ni2+-binding GTPase involved in maturation of urease and hydrogenase
VPVQTILTLGGPPGSGQTPLITGILPGTYTVTETLPTGWAANDVLTKTVSVGIGGTGVVTFNNTAQGNLQIVKNTTGGNGTFTFTTTGPSTVPVQTILTLGGPPGSGTTPLITGILPGTYTVVESLPAGWVTTDVLTKTVSVGINGTGVVTFNNTAQGNLRIVKNTTGGNGTFTFTTTGPSTVPVQTIVTLGGPPGSGQTPLITGILPGTYTVTETLPTGWVTNDVLTKTVSVAIGGTGVVTFNNSALGGLQIVKNTTGGNGTFTFTTTGPSTVPVQTIVTLGGPPGTGSSPLFTGILPGTYTVRNSPSVWRGRASKEACQEAHPNLPVM